MSNKQWCSTSNMRSDIRKAAASERLEDTIDYKKVSKRLQSFIGASQFQLVETLTERVAEIIIKEFKCRG